MFTSASLLCLCTLHHLSYVWSVLPKDTPTKIPGDPVRLEPRTPGLRVKQFTTEPHRNPPPPLFVTMNLFFKDCRGRPVWPWIYVAESAEQDQPAHTCSLILLCTLYWSIIIFCHRNSSIQSTVIYLFNGKNFNPRARPIFFLRIDDSHCDRIHSSLTVVNCFDNGLIGKAASGLEITLCGVLVKRTSEKH